MSERIRVIETKQFSVTIKPDPGGVFAYKWEVSSGDGGVLTLPLFRGSSSFRLTARWAARHAIRLSLKGEETWKVTMTRDKK